MKLTTLEFELLCAGNPPHLGDLPNSIHHYTEEQKARLVKTYTRRRSGYRQIAEECGFHPTVARDYLYRMGVLRKRAYTPKEHYDLMAKHLLAGKSSREIAKLCGWELRKVRNMRECLRKQGRRPDLL